MPEKHPHNYQILYITEPIDIPSVLAKLQGDEQILGLDIETAKRLKYKDHVLAGLSPSLSKIRLVQIASEKLGAVCVFDIFALSKEARKDLYTFIQNRVFFAYTAQFELAHFRNVGVKLNVHCSQVLFRMFLKANQFIEDKQVIAAPLHQAVKAMLGLDISKEEQKSNWNARKLTDSQLTYAARDAVYCLLIGRHLLPKIKESMPRAYSINKATLPVLAKMSLRGMNFNGKAHRKLIKSWEKTFEDSEAELQGQFGEINFGSPAQLTGLIKDEFPKLAKIWPLTASKKFLKSDHDTLVKMADANEHIQELLKWKKYRKLITTYGDSLLKVLNPVTGRMHSSFSLAYTATGRLSSFAPNVQNIPRKSGVREQFCAPPGRILVGADFSQIEAKLAALISGDRRFIETFASGKDLYIYIASEILRIPYERLDKESPERQIGKSCALGLLFGMAAKAFQEYSAVNFGVQLTLGEAQKMVEAFRELFPTFREWQLEQARTCASTLKAYTLSGMQRKLKRGRTYTLAMNTPIQGSAAEIILCSLVRVDNSLMKHRIDAFPVNCIHDEILLEADKRCAKVASELLVKCMTRGFHDVIPDTKGITKIVDVKIAENWAKTK